MAVPFTSDGGARRLREETLN